MWGWRQVCVRKRKERWGGQKERSDARSLKVIELFKTPPQNKKNFIVVHHRNQRQRCTYNRVRCYIHMLLILSLTSNTTILDGLRKLKLTYHCMILSTHFHRDRLLSSRLGTGVSIRQSGSLLPGSPRFDGLSLLPPPRWSDLQALSLFDDKSPHVSTAIGPGLPVQSFPTP